MMGCCNKSTRPNRVVMRRPEWQDPAYVLVSSEASQPVVTVPAGTPTLVARPSPRRWAIGFMPLSGVSTGWLVATHDQPNISSWVLTDRFADNWFDLATIGPFVCLGWWLFNAAGGQMRVLTVNHY